MDHNGRMLFTVGGVTLDITGCAQVNDVPIKVPPVVRNWLNPQPLLIRADMDYPGYVLTDVNLN